MLAEVRKVKTYNIQSTLQMKVINTLNYNGTPMYIHNKECFVCSQENKHYIENDSSHSCLVQLAIPEKSRWQQLPCAHDSIKKVKVG